MSRRIIIGMILAVLLAVGLTVYLWPRTAQAPTGSQTTKPNNTTTTDQKPAPTADEIAVPPKFSLEDPASPWVVVNKKRPLPSTYVPGDLIGVGNSQQLRTEAATALRKLLDDASANGTAMRAISGYRSYVNQTAVYGGYVQRDGQAQADTYSARPGHSEHQTGLAVDLGNGTCDLEICFSNTAAGKWLTAHAHEYGFIIRYLDGKTAITGYQYEPWHLRFVGTDLAKALHASGKTMEEHFSLPAAANY